MDHMCTISFHMYSFPVAPQAVYLIHNDRSQAAHVSAVATTRVAPAAVQTLDFGQVLWRQNHPADTSWQDNGTSQSRC